MALSVWVSTALPLVPQTGQFVMGVTLAWALFVVGTAQQSAPWSNWFAPLLVGVQQLDMSYLLRLGVNVNPALNRRNRTNR